VLETFLKLGWTSEKFRAATAGRGARGVMLRFGPPRSTSLVDLFVRDGTTGRHGAHLPREQRWTDRNHGKKKSERLGG
jgi:hypothetical protein